MTLRKAEFLCGLSSSILKLCTNLVYITLEGNRSTQQEICFNKSFKTNRTI